MGATTRGTGTTSSAKDTDDLVRLREVAQAPGAERAVDAVREFLGMEVAFISRMTETEQTMLLVRGEAGSFGIQEGAVFPAEETYCKRVLEGRLPNLIPDVRAEDRAASLPGSEESEIGAYASVPLTLSDGTIHGTLCAISHRAHPELGYRELQFLHVFARIIADGIEREALATDARGLELQAAAAQTLIAAVQARDAYTATHSRELVDQAVATALRLGLSDEDAAEVKLVALLHDIGKLAVPDRILGKPGSLDEREWEVMQTHSARGESLIRSAPGLEHLGPAIRAEHERWDGDGYPDGLHGDQIPMASRITFVCDAYHAMTSDRPYRRALTLGAARNEIENGMGSQFCPACARAFLAVLDESS